MMENLDAEDIRLRKKLHIKNEYISHSGGRQST